MEIAFSKDLGWAGTTKMWGGPAKRGLAPRLGKTADGGGKILGKRGEDGAAASRKPGSGRLAWWWQWTDSPLRAQDPGFNPNQEILAQGAQGGLPFKLFHQFQPFPERQGKIERTFHTCRHNRLSLAIPCHGLPPAGFKDQETI
jgi:hypothetical protein